MKAKYLLPFVLCFCLSACGSLVFFGAGTAAGVGGYKFYKGSLTVIYQAPYIETWDATLKALDHMNLQIETKKHDLTEAKIKAKTVDNKPVHITLKYKSSEQTEVVIKVGFFGDKAASMAIKDEIRKTLFES